MSDGQYVAAEEIKRGDAIYIGVDGRIWRVGAEDRRMKPGLWSELRMWLAQEMIGLAVLRIAPRHHYDTEDLLVTLQPYWKRSAERTTMRITDPALKAKTRRAR